MAAEAQRTQRSGMAGLPRALLLLVALALAWGCDTPPVFSVPSGPPRAIALDVRLPVDVLGTWTVDGFSQTLRLELAKYNIKVVDRRSRPGVVALIDLGRLTYRAWQEIDVAVAHDDKTTPLGRIALTDTSMTTFDVAAQSVATLIARWIWATPLVTPGLPAAPSTQSGDSPAGKGAEGAGRGIQTARCAGSVPGQSG